MRRLAAPMLLVALALLAVPTPAGAQNCAKQVRAVASAKKAVTKAQKAKAATPPARKQRAKRVKAAKTKHARSRKALATCQARRRPTSAPKVAGPPAPAPTAPSVIPETESAPQPVEPAPVPVLPVIPPREPPPVPTPDLVPSVTVFAGTVSTIPYLRNSWITATYDALTLSPGMPHRVTITVDTTTSGCWSDRTEYGTDEAAGAVTISPNPPGWPPIKRMFWCTGNARATLYRGAVELAHEDFRIVE